MYIKNKITLPITFAMVISGIIGGLLINSVLSGLIERQQESAQKNTWSILDSAAQNKVAEIQSSIRRMQQKALEETSLFTNMPEIIAIYEFALTGNIDDESDPIVQKSRTQLRQFIKPIVEGYKNSTGLSEFKLHFHLPNGRSLLRVWRDGWQTKRNGRKIDISDDISSFRNTVVEINQGKHAPISGIEVGRAGFAIRGLAPIHSDTGAHLGSNEVLLPIDQLLTVSKTDQQSEYAIYMDASLLPTAKKLQDPQRYPILQNKYVLTSYTDADITNALATANMLNKGRDNVFSERVNNHYVTVFPIKDYSKKTIGVMLIAKNIHHQLEELDKIVSDGTAIKYKLGVYIFLGILGFTLFTWIVVSQLTKLVVETPLSTAVMAAQRITEGKLNFPIEASSNDEIGNLLQHMNTMRQTLRGLVAEINQVSSQVGTAANHLIKQVDDASQKINQQSRDIDGLAVSISHMSSSSSEIANNTEKAAITSGQIVEESNHGSHVVAQTISSINELAKEVSNATSVLKQLETNSENIDSVVSVIHSIAEQTNLLALNAAIEAARAGESGRGFAVVADEVRKLASRTQNSTQEIQEIVSLLQKTSVNAVTVMNQGNILADSSVNNAGIAGKSLNAIIENMQLISEMNQQIADATSEQTVSANEINGAISHIKQAVESTANSAEATKKAGNDLISQSDHLYSLVKKFEV